MATKILNSLACVSVLVWKENLCFTITAALLKYSDFKCAHFHLSLSAIFHLAKQLSIPSCFPQCQFLDHLFHTVFSLTGSEFPSHCESSCPAKPSAVFTSPGRLCKQEVVDGEELKWLCPLIHSSGSLTLQWPQVGMYFC